MLNPALLTAQDCTGHVHLVVGCGPLAASRCAKSLQVGARPSIIAPATSEVHYTLAKSVEDGLVRWVQGDFEEQVLYTLGREEVDHFVDAVFVTTGPRDPMSATISQLCKRKRIPVNVVDAPRLCTFTLLSTHSDGPLQIGITTSGRGCKLSSRIRREIASSLPSKFGEAIERLGTMRKRIWEEDYKMQQIDTAGAELEVEDEDTIQKHTFNNLVKEEDTSSNTLRTRRMRWLSQICEYWPLSRLAAITDDDVSAILAAYTSTQHVATPSTDTSILPALPLRKGCITLAGSGPGHPGLLTRSAHEAIETADFILADKLVPAEIMSLIPRRTPVHIARKFPGNADAAQEEMLQLGLTAARQGKHVLRLKQGDPYLYGRGAEEVSFFRQHGFQIRVIPGVTSALSAPLFAEVPVTHRAVADQVVVCTGTGRKGAAPTPPSYTPSKTVVFLMALHRLSSLVESLVERTQTNGDLGAESEDEKRTRWPANTPCAVIERASCPDQRVIRTTLEHVVQAIEEEGSRPPGLLVVGAACEVLHQPLAGQRWTTEEGFRALDEVGGQRDAGLDILKDLALQAGEEKAGERGMANGIPSRQAVGSDPGVANAA
jgi:uroporphyrin-III C-methyltransferase